MARQFSRTYTSGHEILEDGSVAFSCSTDTEEWPWLTLGPHHPVVVQAQNFWTSVGAILVLGGMEEGQWSALTWTEWRCGVADAAMAVRGTYHRETSGEHEHYVVDLYDAADRAVVQMRGRGVVFRNRNFEEWRGQAKRKAQARADTGSFAFAPRDALGIGKREYPLIGPLGDSTFPALVSRENGLPPANPMLGGSGDHVNSVHMIEVARQALCLLTGDPQVQVTGGEMELNRYVELGTPFELRVEARSESETVLMLAQLGRDCAQLTLKT